MRQASNLKNLELDLLRMKARRAGRVLDLTPKEFALLSLLARHKGEVFSRNAIAEQVWGMRLGGDTNVIDVHISRLRKKLNPDGNAPMIETVRGSGYKLHAPD